jgi:dTDP-4-dehydrorhamnose 3,5-epimerase
VKVEPLGLEGLLLVRPSVFRDTRGFFLESYNAEKYRAHGIDCAFPQDNHSRSVQGTLRGLHYQSHPGQAKLIRVVRGRIFDVAVDIRLSSATFGKWVGVELDGESHAQLYIPVGFAHGFCTLSEEAEVLYKVSSVHDPTTECQIAYDDPEVGVAWPVSNPLLSDRDRAGESLAAYRRRMSECRY